MKLRAGPGGDDMFPACKTRGIASFTHRPIYNTDFTNLQKADVDHAVKGSARPSIFCFAWTIEGGDVIYVGDSETHCIVGRGIVGGKPGKRAYRFNNGDAMTEPRNPRIAWRHEVPVDWDEDFSPFEYKDPAPQNSVIQLHGSGSDKRNDANGSPDETVGQVASALLNELAYQRETSASKKNIERLHASLSNQFRVWLKRSFGIDVKQEENSIDLIFTFHAETHLAELKICYCGNTKHAIREALGQLLEYNHYPPHCENRSWWLVLDCEPSRDDRKYISTLRQKYRFPLILAWRDELDFETSPSSPLRT